MYGREDLVGACAGAPPPPAATDATMLVPWETGWYRLVSAGLDQWLLQYSLHVCCEKNVEIPVEPRSVTPYLCTHTECDRQTRGYALIPIEASANTVFNHCFLNAF
jgi:hypothetical protein